MYNRKGYAKSVMSVWQHMHGCLEVHGILNSAKSILQAACRISLRLPIQDSPCILPLDLGMARRIYSYHTHSKEVLSLVFRAISWS